METATQPMVKCFHYFPERREIYFIAIIDVLTQYGVKKQVIQRIKYVKCFANRPKSRCQMAECWEFVIIRSLFLLDILFSHKKQAAKAAKTVKYGSNVDGISTCDPEQYAKRFIEFMDKAIE